MAWPDIWTPGRLDEHSQADKKTEKRQRRFAGVNHLGVFAEYRGTQPAISPATTLVITRPNTSRSRKHVKAASRLASIATTSMTKKAQRNWGVREPCATLSSLRKPP